MNIARLILVMLLPIIGGCASHAPAPVIDRSVAPPTAKPAAPAAAGVPAGYYVVKKGDTLYSIALDHGQDHRDLAAWNNLQNPNMINVGQQLRVIPPGNASAVAVVSPVTSSGPIQVTSGGGAAPAAANGELLKREPKGGTLAYSDQALAKAREAETAEPAKAEPQTRPAEPPPPPPPDAKPAATGNEVEWMWPTNGKLIVSFAEGGGKGIDIAGKSGDPVLAAAAGVVSYAGAGLRGYGNLVVLRHNATYLSVYAHNSKILVKEKQAVAKGQKIAEMGSTDAESPRLHFEIRLQGKPADPQKFLPAR